MRMNDGLDCDGMVSISENLIYIFTLNIQSKMFPAPYGMLKWLEERSGRIDQK